MCDCNTCDLCSLPPFEVLIYTAILPLADVHYVLLVIFQVFFLFEDILSCKHEYIIKWPTSSEKFRILRKKRGMHC